MYRLREIERRDITTINRWRNNPDLIACLGAPFRYINIDVDNKWFDVYMSNRNNAVRCAITVDGNDDIVGLVSLLSIDYINQSAALHIMIGDSQNQEKGIGTFAINAMLDHAFNNMNLHRVELTVLDDNQRAKRAYEKCGFSYEGRKRKANFKNGRFVDALIYAVLREDFHKTEIREREREDDLPTWCITEINHRTLIDTVIKNCDGAFFHSVSTREDYPILLEKIHQRGKVIVAHRSEPMAYCAFYANNSETRDAFITLIAVKTQFQNLHIGKSLLHKCFELSASNGMVSCSLGVQKNNASAIKFYRMNGFNFVEGREKSYIMRRAL